MADTWAVSLGIVTIVIEPFLWFIPIECANNGLYGGMLNFSYSFFFVVWIVRKCIHSCIHQWETISEWRTTRNENNAQVHLSVHFFVQIFILQCDSITMQKCRVLCVNVAIVMNEKHNNRSGNSFRAHHRSSKIFIRSIWQDLQMQYKILIKERWACEMKKKNQPFNGERGESNYCHSNFFCKFINMQLYIVDIESSVFCVRLSTFFFLLFFRSMKLNCNTATLTTAWIDVS